VDIGYGGKVVVRDASIGYCKTVVRVAHTSYQLNTLTVDGVSIDAGGHPPVFLVVEQTSGRVNATFANCHISHPHTDRAMLKIDGDAHVTLRNVGKIGRLCEGGGTAAIKLDWCELSDGAIPGRPGGLASGVIGYSDGHYSVTSLRRY
jgi:hypothetical protein